MNNSEHGEEVRTAPQPEKEEPLDESPVLGQNLDDPRLYLDRELSMLSFFWRVLEEAQDKRNPLLERVKFLAIVSSNLAEFFMIRVAGLKQQIEAGIAERTPAGLTPSQQLYEVRREAQRLMNGTRECLKELIGLLGKEKVHILDYDQLDEAQRTVVNRYFRETVFPVLTPLAVDPARPFPHISNMSLNLAVVVRGPDGIERFARVKLPNTLPRFVRADDEPAGSVTDPTAYHLVWLDQLIAANLKALFPGMEIVESYPFRLTRDAEVPIQELEAQDLLETVEKGIRQRRFGRAVRITVVQDMPDPIRAILIDNLVASKEEVYTLRPPLGMSDLMQLYNLDRPDLKSPPFVGGFPPALAEGEEDLFAAIRRQDILLHHPFDSFLPVIDFLRNAAHDPAVLAIKQTLYRVGQNSPIVEELLNAARNGKQVAALVELKARFDEESNIEWARALEREGVHVVYGLLGLKAHLKLALVVRQEGQGIRRYVHLSSGNYNATTARQYTDIGMFTCDPAIGEDASDLFNYLTGYSEKNEYRKLLVAPIGLRHHLESLIHREIEHKRNGREAHLIFKTNAIVDKTMIELLYRASQAGIQVDLLVRGMCCLRPGLPGLSENIRVTSIVGRFLEHSRIYYFRNGGDEQVFLGSPDLMVRNLDRRVEVLFPVEDRRLIRHIRDDILEVYLADNVKARIMSGDGSYSRRRVAPGERRREAQELLLSHRATTAE